MVLLAKFLDPISIAQINDNQFLGISFQYNIFFSKFRNNYLKIDGETVTPYKRF